MYASSDLTLRPRRFATDSSLSSANGPSKLATNTTTSRLLHHHHHPDEIYHPNDFITYHPEELEAVSMKPGGGGRGHARLSHKLIPTFALETLSLVCLCVLAYYLHCEDVFPVLIRGFRCDDTTIGYPRFPLFSNGVPPFSGISELTLFSIVMAVPIGLVSAFEKHYLM